MTDCPDISGADGFIGKWGSGSRTCHKETQLPWQVISHNGGKRVSARQQVFSGCLIWRRLPLYSDTWVSDGYNLNQMWQPMVRAWPTPQVSHLGLQKCKAREAVEVHGGEERDNSQYPLLRDCHLLCVFLCALFIFRTYFLEILTNQNPKTPLHLGWNVKPSVKALLPLGRWVPEASSVWSKVSRKLWQAI